MSNLIKVHDDVAEAVVSDKFTDNKDVFVQVDTKDRIVVIGRGDVWFGLNYNDIEEIYKYIKEDE